MLPWRRINPFWTICFARGERAAEPQRLDLEARGLDPQIEFARFSSPGTVAVQRDDELVGHVQRVGELGEPARSLCRRHLGRYANHIDPPAPDNTLSPGLIIVPFNLVRSGAETV